MNFKILLVIPIFALFLHAEEANEILAKAQSFEANGDYKNAMIYYKKLALQNITETTAPKNTAPEISALEILPAKISDAEISQNEISHTKTPTQNSADIGFLGLKHHEPIYMLFTHDFSEKLDRKADEAHFAFSFERPIAYDFFGFDEKISFAYTQNSWWQITQDSAPFRESNYSPELYVSAPVPFADELKIGVLHESNGKSGEESRAWNKLYVQNTWRYGGFELTPRAWYAFWIDDTNEDIAQYMGYGDVRASYTFGRHKLSALWRNNLRLGSQNRGAAQIDFTFPLFNSGFYGYFRYFSGYGESLADYKKVSIKSA